MQGLADKSINAGQFSAKEAQNILRNAILKGAKLDPCIAKWVKKKHSKFFFFGNVSVSFEVPGSISQKQQEALQRLSFALQKLELAGVQLRHSVDEAVWMLVSSGGWDGIGLKDIFVADGAAILALALLERKDKLEFKGNGGAVHPSVIRTKLIEALEKTGQKEYSKMLKDIHMPAPRYDQFKKKIMESHEKYSGRGGLILIAGELRNGAKESIYFKHLSSAGAAIEKAEQIVLGWPEIPLTYDTFIAGQKLLLGRKAEFKGKDGHVKLKGALNYDGTAQHIYSAYCKWEASELGWAQ